MVRLLAATTVRVIEDLLPGGKLGHLSSNHHLCRLVHRLRTIDGNLLREEGEQLWAELVHSTRDDWMSHGMPHPRQNEEKTFRLTDDIDEVFELDEGPFPSSERTMEYARRFREWLQRTYVPPADLLVDLESRTIYFNGKIHEGFNCDEGLRMLKYLAKYPTKWISQPELYRKAHGLKEGEKVPDTKKIREFLNSLGKFSQYIESKPGVGRRLRLPPVLQL